ncbi:MAG TPA: MFS transporter [Ktedonosporobacter sp.]|nr:MFS transporter [Ktedonosporobacter sp.]
MSYTTSPRREAPEQGKPRALWRNTDFLLLWSGQTVSVVGSNLSQVALPLLILALTHSPAQAGLVVALQIIPYLLFSLPAGALIDRWDRKKAMIYCDMIRWLALGSVPLAFFLGYLSAPQIYLVAFIEGTANVIFTLAQISSLPRTVQPEQLPQAYALSEITESTGSLLGPLLGALLTSLARTTVVGAVLAYLVDSVSYLVSIISLRFIRTPFQMERAGERKQSLWQEIAEGLGFLWHQKLLRILALLTMAVNFLMSQVPVAIIVLARDQLHLNDATIYLIFCVNGVGGLLGGLIAPWLKAHLRLGQIIIGSVLVWTLALALRAMAPSVLLLLIAGGTVNMMWPIYAVALVSYRLSLAPDELLGRINSAFRFLTYGIEGLGAFIGGLLLVPLGPRTELWLIAAGLAISGIVACGTQLRQA